MSGYEFQTGIYDKAILAVGSTEYHGLHLPYGTDTIVSEHLAIEVATKVKGMLVLPSIPYGMSAHYSSFPIAISIKTKTLMQILREIFDSLRKQGLLRLLIINGHDGNIPAIEAITNEYRAEYPEFRIAVLSSWWVTAGKLVPKNTFEVWGGLGHGGEGETSMLLKIAPNLVDMSKAKGIVPKLPSHIDLKWIFDELTPYGVTGDPTKATKEKGNLMNQALIKLLIEFVENLDKKQWNVDKGPKDSK
jgi:creatinine amidohydrolase